jgi:hypothetical protein
MFLGVALTAAMAAMAAMWCWFAIRRGVIWGL